MTYYYIEKMGTYGHGIYWIGTDIEAGKTEADRLANADEDAYHSWDLRELEVIDGINGPEPNSSGEPLYIGVRDETVRKLKSLQLDEDEIVATIRKLVTDNVKEGLICGGPCHLYYKVRNVTCRVLLDSKNEIESIGVS